MCPKLDEGQREDNFKTHFNQSILQITSTLALFMMLANCVNAALLIDENQR